MGIHIVLSHSLIHHVEKQVNELGDSSMLYKFLSLAYNKPHRIEKEIPDECVYVYGR